MVKIILISIAIILSLLGVIMIYDARDLTKKLFSSFGDQNEATMGFKIFGFLLAIISIIIILLIENNK